jgi:hypothetical protein
VGVATSSRTPAAAPAPTVTPIAAPTSPTSTPSALPSGSDANEELAPRDGSRQAASAFVKAWLDPDPKTRKPALKEVAAPALVEELMLTDPENIPRASPTGKPVLEQASLFSVQFSQALSTGMTIRIYLVSEPEARYGWLATSVERA